MSHHHPTFFAKTSWGDFPVREKDGRITWISFPAEKVLVNGMPASRQVKNSRSMEKTPPVIRRLEKEIAAFAVLDLLDTANHQASSLLDGYEVQPPNTGIFFMLLISETPLEVFLLLGNVQGTSQVVPKRENEPKISVDVSSRGTVVNLMHGWAAKNMTECPAV